MADSFQVMFGDPPTGAPQALYDALTSLEVEENADLPGAFQLTVPVVAQGASGSEDLSYVGDANLKPYARVAVIATADGKRAECIFDGYVLSHKISLDRGTTSASLQVWGQDATCVMNLKEQVKAWPAGKTDGQIANDIFKNTYNFDTANENLDDDSPAHDEALHTIMQRATDAQFLRELARRNGKLFRVACADQAGKITGYFAKPTLEGDPVLTLTLNPPGAATVDALTFEWDVARPSHVYAQLLIDKKDPEKQDLTDSGHKRLDQTSLGTYVGSDHVMEARVTTTGDSVGELKLRAAAILREAGWFVKCEGEADLSRVKAVMRVGTLVRINGAGALHSGDYLVWSVRHAISGHAHRMKFVLVRNAVGRT